MVQIPEAARALFQFEGMDPANSKYAQHRADVELANYIAAIRNENQLVKAYNNSLRAENTVLRKEHDERSSS